MGESLDELCYFVKEVEMKYTMKIQELSSLYHSTSLGMHLIKFIPMDTCA